MKLVIGHLYNDLMNLYGEIGNIKALVWQLEKQGVDVEVKNLSLDDKIDFTKLDLVYIGSGTEENRLLVLNDLMRYQKKIKETIDNNKFFLVTGNALALFGKSITDIDGNCHDALNIFDFYTMESKTRIVKEVITKTKLVKDEIYGFMNHSDVVFENSNYLFSNEGILYNNFYATHMIGPLLVRNPLFLKYFIKKLVNSKNKTFKFKSFNLKLEQEACKEYNYFKKTKKHIK